MPGPKSASSSSPPDGSARARARSRWRQQASEPASGRRSDTQLVDLMQAGNPYAFELVYERHSAAALGLARRMVGDKSLAEDVTQEAFVSAWRGSANYRSERGSVRTWVLGITRNRAIDALRRRTAHERSRTRAQASADRWVDPEPTGVEAARLDEARTLRRAIGALPDEQRQTVELSYFGGLTQTEVAATLGLPLGTVKGRMRLALEKLRGALAPEVEVA